jgi:hypothetical protein
MSEIVTPGNVAVRAARDDVRLYMRQIIIDPVAANTVCVTAVNARFANDFLKKKILRKVATSSLGLINTLVRLEHKQGAPLWSLGVTILSGANFSLLFFSHQRPPVCSVVTSALAI